MENIIVQNENSLEVVDEEIIPIYEVTDTGNKVVNAKELHEYLKIKTRFNDWVRRQIDKYEFEEGLDFYSFLSKTSENGGRPSKEYIFTLDTGKELGMVENNEEGRRIRKYFIEFEKRGREILRTVPKTYPEALRLYADAVEEREKLEIENKKKDQKIGELQPKADYTDKILNSEDTLTITQIAKDYGMSGRAMNSLLHDLEVQYKQSGQWLLYSKHQAKGYTDSEVYEYERKDGSIGTTLNTKWTMKGRLFLYNLLKEEGILPLIEQE